MFGAHLPEIGIILVLALVFFGPKRLPEIGSSLGRGIRDFKSSVAGLDEAHASSSMQLPSGAPEPEPVEVPASER